jgi:hypothetical protein
MNGGIESVKTNLNAQYFQHDYSPATPKKLHQHHYQTGSQTYAGNWHGGSSQEFRPDRIAICRTEPDINQQGQHPGKSGCGATGYSSYSGPATDLRLFDAIPDFRSL